MMGDDRLTNREAAEKLGCSISTARRWMCSWCDQDMLSIAQGVCGSLFDKKCDTEAKVRDFRSSRRPLDAG